jgi:hypothetical protein
MCCVKKMRTAAGNVTADARKKHATLEGGRFPIFDKQSAISALKLRGHAGGDRGKVIAKAARYAPEAAKKARQTDRR